MRPHMVLYCALVRVEPSNSAVMKWLSGGGGEGWALNTPEIMTSSSSCWWETLSPFRRLWNSSIYIIEMSMNFIFPISNSLLQSISEICSCCAFAKAAQNVGNIPTTLLFFPRSTSTILCTLSSGLLFSQTSAAYFCVSSLRCTRYGTTSSGDISSNK